MSYTPIVDSHVICPKCVHQFRAIPVDVQAELATLRAALAELVACKDLKDEVMQMRRMWSECTDAEMEAGDPDGIAKWADYERRKPLAWATARALATKEPQP